jgi:hypothetical protein
LGLFHTVYHPGQVMPNHPLLLYTFLQEISFLGLISPERELSKIFLVYMRSTKAKNGI